MVEAKTSREPVGTRTWFGHPIGLANLFGVELWERFSFYGMVTVLGYYLYYSATDGGLGLSKDTAVGIVGAYGGLVYLSTVLGGWIADRLPGMARTLFYGGFVVMAGHIALAVHSTRPGGFPGSDNGIVFFSRLVSARRCRVVWLGSMTQVTSSPISVSPGTVMVCAGLIVAAIAPWISKFMAGVH